MWLVTVNNTIIVKVIVDIAAVVVVITTLQYISIIIIIISCTSHSRRYTQKHYNTIFYCAQSKPVTVCISWQVGVYCLMGDAEIAGLQDIAGLNISGRVSRVWVRTRKHAQILLR